MCRGKNICSELETDTNTWRKESPLPKPEWMNNEVDLFISAVEAFIAGNKNLCL